MVLSSQAQLGYSMRRMREISKTDKIAKMLHGHQGTLKPAVTVPKF